MLGDLLDHRFRSSGVESAIAHPAGFTHHLFHCSEPHTAEPEFFNFKEPKNRFQAV
jgi:hypothetical protein